MVSSTINLQLQAGPRMLVYWLVVLAGLLLGGPLDMIDWQGSANLHTMMEAVAAVASLTVFGFTLVQYKKTGIPTFLFVSMAFLGTSILDIYHAAVTSTLVTHLMPSNLPALIPWSWTASRLFLAVLLFWSWTGYKRARRMGQAGATDIRVVFIGTLMFVVLAIVFFATAPLPSGYSKGVAIHRPQELIPAFFFLLALIGYLRKGEWQHNVFEHWLILALLFSLICQVLIMPFSSQLFDTQFDAAHLLKIVSYLCVLTGCLKDLSPRTTTGHAQPVGATTHRKSRLQLGIGGKFALLCGLVVILATTPVAINSSRSLHTLALNNGLQRLANEASSAGHNLRHTREIIAANLRYLSLTNPVMGLYRAKLNQGFDTQEGSTTAHWQTSLTNLMHSMMETHPDYLELTYRDPDSREAWVQLVRRDGVIQHLAEMTSDLNTDRLPFDGLSWSHIYLNRENGEITTPITPVLEVSLPTHNADDQVIGLFSLRVDMTETLATPPTERIGTRWYVVNAKGEFLAHPDHENVLKSKDGSSYRLNDEFPRLAEQLENTNTVVTTGSNRDGVMTELALGMFHTDYGKSQIAEALLFISATERSKLDRDAVEFGRVQRLNAQIVLAVAILLGWIFAQLLVHPVRFIAQATTEFGETGRQQSLPVGNHDEIGTLARAVSRMMTQISERSVLVTEKIEQNKAESITKPLRRSDNGENRS